MIVRPAAEGTDSPPVTLHPSAVAARPLAVIAAAYVAGDALGLCLPPVGAAVALTLLTPTCVLLSLRMRSLRMRSLRGHVCAALLFMLLGLSRGYLAVVPGPHDPSWWAAGRFADITGTVEGEPQRSASGISFVLAAEQIQFGDGRTAPVSGRVSVWLPFGQNKTAGSLLEVDPGDRLVVHGRLDRPDAARNPGGFDSEVFLAARSTHSVLLARRPSDLREQSKGDSLSLQRLASGVRDSFLGGMRRVLTDRDVDLLGGIVLGARSQMDPRLEDDFSRTGTIHVLATAGLHVGIVAGALLWLWQRLLLPRRWAALATILCLILYALAAGGRPSVSRAVLMASLYLAAYLLDREPDGPTALGAAALCLLGGSPELLLDVGFQLSFATVAVIFAIMSAVSMIRARREAGRENRPRRTVSGWIREWLGSLFLLSVAAQAGAAPLTAQYFHLFSPVSVFANLLVVPAVGLILIGALALWPVAWGAAALAKGVAAWTIGPLLAFVVTAVRLLADLPGASWSVAPPGWPLLLLIYGALFLAAWVLGRRERA